MPTTVHPLMLLDANTVPKVHACVASQARFFALVSTWMEHALINL
jgi:hypothetical protein